jgi:hypothetical protein
MKLKKEQETQENLSSTVNCFHDLANQMKLTQETQETQETQDVVINLMMILLTSQAYQPIESSLYERAKLILKNDNDLIKNFLNSLQSKD